MSGVSHKTPLKAWQWVMDHAGWEKIAQMARATELPETTCHSYVFDGKMPSLDRALLIANAAGIKLDELARRLNLELGS